MDNNEAMEILIAYKKWRHGGESAQPIWDTKIKSTEFFFEAIDCAIQALGDGWISVDERLPESKDLCLCTTDHGYSFRYWKGNHFEGEHIANEPKVSYWMYAPSPPKPKQP